MTMREGMLWFDNSERGIAERVAKAATAYNTKYSRQPQLCYVHPSMIPGAPSTRAAGIEIRANNSILPNHFWIGVDEDAVKPATPVRNAPQAGAEVQAQPAKPIKIKWHVLHWNQPFSMLYYRTGALLRINRERAQERNSKRAAELVDFWLSNLEMVQEIIDRDFPIQGCEPPAAEAPVPDEVSEPIGIVIPFRSRQVNWELIQDGVMERKRVYHKPMLEELPAPVEAAA